MKKDLAFSGLEAAIVLIAFVVVAAVFSYVMLGAGFFATQKSQEVTYSGIKQATANLVLDGQVYGSTVPVQRVEFNIAIAEGSQSQLLGDIDFVTTTSNAATPVSHTSTLGTASFYTQLGVVVAAPATTVMKPGDKYLVKLDMSATPVPSGGSFTVEMKPKIGASTLISKSLNTGFSSGIII